MTVFSDFGFGKLHLEQTIGNSSLVMFVCINKVTRDRYLFIMDEYNIRKFVVVPITIETLCEYLSGIAKFEEIVFRKKSFVISFYKPGLSSITAITKIQQYEYIRNELNIYPKNLSTEKYVNNLASL